MYIYIHIYIKLNADGVTNQELSVTRVLLLVWVIERVCVCVGTVCMLWCVCVCVCVWRERGDTDTEMPPSPIQAAVPLASTGPTRSGCCHVAGLNRAPTNSAPKKKEKRKVARWSIFVLVRWRRLSSIPTTCEPCRSVQSSEVYRLCSMPMWTFQEAAGQAQMSEPAFLKGLPLHTQHGRPKKNKARRALKYLTCLIW